MARDRSLDEFAAGSEESPGSDRASEVEPIESTTIWSPDGGACAECNSEVKRRWRADEGLVCADCKSW